MRWLGLCGVVLAACGGTEEGALLVLDAPDGATATRIEIVLASAHDDDIDDIDGQRTQPGDLAMEPVRYYRQRAVTGALTDVGALDGFAVRLEANAASVPDGELIPFLIAFDDDQVTAIGSVLDNGEPARVEIVPGQLLRFTVEMTEVAQTDGNDGIQPHEAVVVECDFGPSGIAWNPGAGQLRLLLPDRSQDPTATDASRRKTDMDCDGHKAVFDDCDDLRSTFHRGAEETCGDGIDHDCDFETVELVPCTATNTVCGDPAGFAVCSDRSGDAGTEPPACQAQPECDCANGADCNACILPFSIDVNVAEKNLCRPAVANLVAVPACSQGCEVVVLQRPDDPFRVEIAKPGSTVFDDKLTGVVDKIQIKVDGVDQLAAEPTEVVGGIILGVIPPDGAMIQLQFALKLSEAPSECPVDGAAVMTCLP